MKKGSGIIETWLCLLCLAAIALGAGSIFFFTGAELYGGKPESRFWSNYIKDGKFAKKNGIIYIDRLDRTIEYRMDISLDIHGIFELNPPVVDRKTVTYKITKRDITPEGRNKRNEYQISFIIPVSDENGAVIGLSVTRPPVFRKNPKTDSIYIKSAQIGSVKKGHEIGHLLWISLISAVVGMALFFIIKKFIANNLTAFLFAAAAIMTAVLLFNSFSFRYVYAVFERPLSVFFYFSVMIAFLVSGFLRILKTEKHADKSASPENAFRKKTAQRKSVEDRINISKHNLRNDIFAYFALFILVTGIFSYNFGNDFVSDDFFLLRDYGTKELLGTFAGPSDPFGCCPKYYRPLSVVYFDIQHSLFGSCYPLYYLLRFFHFYFNCALLYALLKKLGLRPSSSWAAAAVMALSVYSSIAAGWLSSAYDVLMITFILLGVHFRTGEKNNRNAVLSYLCFIAALMTKEPAVILPFFFIGLDLIFHRKWKRNDYLFHLACIFTLIFYFILRTHLFGGLAGMEQKHYFFSFSNIPGIIGRIVKIFILMFLRPGGDLVQYSKSISISALCWPLLIIIFIVAGVSSFAKIKTREYANQTRILLTGLLWILLFLLPIIFPFDFHRLAYILVPGVAIAIAAFFDILRSSPLPSLAKTAAMIVLLLALANQSVRNMQIGYNRLGKGSQNRFNVNVAELKTWDKNLPTEIKQIWKKKLYERK